MTGFQLSPEAVEAAAREAFWRDDLGGHIKGRWTWDTIPDEGRENYRAMARDAVSAALPVLAESPELVDVLAERLYTRNHLTDFGDLGNWEGEGEAHKETWRDIARVDLRALFAAAPTDTTEENT